MRRGQWRGAAGITLAPSPIADSGRDLFCVSAPMKNMRPRALEGSGRARERRRNEGNGRVGAMGEERLSFLCIPRPFLHAAEVFYAWRPVHAPAAGIFYA